MAKNEIWDVIQSILKETFFIEDCKITDNLFSDVGLDSLDYLDFLCQVNKKLNVNVDIKVFNYCKTIEDIIKIYETLNCKK